MTDPQKISHIQIAHIYGLAAGRGTVINDLEKRIKAKYGCRCSGLTSEQAEEIIAAYERTRSTDDKEHPASVRSV